MIAQVILAKRMPQNSPYFDYDVEEKLQANLLIGQLVKIPFRNKQVFGIIKSIKKNHDPNNKLKPIDEAVFLKPLLSKAQINFLQEMSEFYHTSLGFLLKSNLLQ